MVEAVSPPQIMPPAPTVFGRCFSEALDGKLGVMALTPNRKNTPVMNTKKSSALRAGLLIYSALLGLWPAVASAQKTEEPKATTTANANAEAPAEVDKDGTLVLSPFSVQSDKDNGYMAANSVGGSRVNTAIKDIPIPIQVITSEFMNDIGATDLRKSLSYMASIGLQSQNDLENTGGIGGISGGAFGPGGVNNPEGRTSNISGTQLKIRGFITNNVLRDGFLRGSPSDAINIDRIEVVQGPNALLYGTGNFGGVVDYLTRRPQDKQRGDVTLAYGVNNFMRATLDTTGPVSTAQHINYRLDAALESSHTNIDSQKSSHVFIAPSFSWKPTKTTDILVQTEYSKSKQSGFGFRALRAAAPTGGTPINNDQLEATAFYWPPGANKKSFNLSGPDTFNNQQQSNVEILGLQQILKESDYVPQLDFLVGFNLSNYTVHTQDANAGINQATVGNPGFNLSQSITLAAIDNGLDGRTPSNGNLAYGVFPNAVVRYQWNQNNAKTTRYQERVELTAKKSLFKGKWFQLEDQALLGYSEIYQKISADNTQTLSGQYSYKGPNDLTPIRFGVQGDGSAAPGLFKNNWGNINKGWDKAFYLNNFAKLFKFGGVEDRVILMTGVRKDKSDNWSTNTSLDNSTAPQVTVTNVSKQTIATTHQSGVMVKLTNSLSIFGLQAQGFQPNFGGLHEALTGAPVGADTAKSREIGIKFDFLDGKISGSISHYVITKTGWTGSGFSSPAPLGKPKFDPSKPIVYGLGDANGTGFYNPFASTTYLSKDSSGAPVTYNGFVANGQNYTPNAAEQAAWIAAYNAGAISLISPINGKSNSRGSIYLNASTPEGAAWMDAMFAAAAPGWAGWPYAGNSDGDPGVNNAVLDDAAFQNGPQNAAIQTISEARGWDGTIYFTPTKNLQIVVSGAVNNSVTLLNKGKWIKYPYPQDRWATWYFPNGGFGLKGQTKADAYTDPTDTSTRTNTGTFPGDDTPKNRFTFFMNYKFENALKGVIAGIGGDWQSKRAYFSGVTHGSGQVQTDNTGKVLVLYTPVDMTVNLFVRKEWKNSGHNQYVQLNVDNVLNDQKRYGLIYKTPISARLTYGVGF